jgi:hypothetical protein
MLENENKNSKRDAFAVRDWSCNRAATELLQSCNRAPSELKLKCTYLSA